MPIEAKERTQKFAPPRAHQAGDAEHFAGMQKTDDGSCPGAGGAFADWFRRRVEAGAPSHKYWPVATRSIDRPPAAAPSSRLTMVRT